MLQYKDIKNLSELESTFVDRHKKTEFFLKIIDILKIGKFHSIFGSVKQKGVSPLLIIRILITFRFVGQKNVHSFTKSYWNKFAGFGKDIYYRLKNKTTINWRGFLSGVIRQAITTLERYGSVNCVNGQTIKAFIFDDTTIQKTGYKMEGVSRVWDHVVKKHVLGFQLLVMGFYNGSTFMPIDFTFHREKGRNKKMPFNLKPKHLRKQFNKKRALQTPGAKRKKELDISKISAAIKMIKRAVKQNIQADYVLTDSWFTCWEMVRTALENNLHYIGMFSKVKTLFGYRGKQFTYKEIRKMHRRTIKRNRKFNLYYIRTVVEWNDCKVVLYNTRKGKRGKWKTIISTDLSANFSKTVELYQIRWSIEVFFKESKQMLGLGKCQGKDFDSQIADTTISMIQYVFLSLQNQIEKYESLGRLFEKTRDGQIEIKLHERLLVLLLAIIEIIGKLFEQVDSEEIISKMIHDEKAYNQIRSIIIHGNDGNMKVA